jgi:hypothetical protein
MIVFPDQFYNYNACAGGTCDTLPPSRTSGPFLLGKRIYIFMFICINFFGFVEWRDGGSYGFPGAITYGYNVGCQSGTCIDSTTNINWAGIQLS